MTRLQLNLNPSNWLVLEYFGLLNGETTTPPTSTTTPTPPTPETTPPPASIPAEVIQAKINLKTEMKTRIRAVQQLLGFNSEIDTSYGINKWDRIDAGTKHFRDMTWSDYLNGINKDKAGNIGDDTNLTDVKENIIAGITEYLVSIALKGSVGIRTLTKADKTRILTEYMKDYKTNTDKAFYNDGRYKDKIEELGLTVPK